MVETCRRKPGKRCHHCYVVPCKLRSRQLPPLGFPKAPKSVIQGPIDNIGVGGLCPLTNDAMKVPYLLQCEITIPKTPVAIPTLTPGALDPERRQRIDI